MKEHAKKEVFYWLNFFSIGFLIAVAPMLICLLLFELIVAGLAYSGYFSVLILCLAYIFYKSEEENE